MTKPPSPQAVSALLRLWRWLWPPSPPPTVTDHPFTPVPWMRECGYLAHPQASRCFKPRRAHAYGPSTEGETR